MPPFAEWSIAAASNPYFSAGIGLFGVGTAVTFLKHAFINAFQVYKKIVITSMEITSKDPIYHWLLPYLTKNAVVHSHRYSVHANVKKMHMKDAFYWLVPATGTHYATHNGRWIKVERERMRTPSDAANGAPFETLTLSVHGAAKTRILHDVLAAARDAASSQAADSVQLLTAFAGEWRPFGAPKRMRPLRSVVLAAGVKEALIEDLNAFMRSGAWYAAQGIPYRRGYLLHGPPGTGKTSLVHAVASELRYAVAIAALGSSFMTDDRVAQLLANVPARCVLLLEDIDAAFSGRDSQLTLSGLLNALDGMAACDERIVFMTTNDATRLNAALVRPGRVDRRFLLDDATDAQISEFFERFYAGDAANTAQLQTLLRAASGRRASISPAALQNVFVAHRDDPSGAIRQLEALLWPAASLRKSLDTAQSL